MTQMSYAEQLKDPRWQKKRLEILNRDEWKCTWCLSTEMLAGPWHLQRLMGFLEGLALSSEFIKANNQIDYLHPERRAGFASAMIAPKRETIDGIVDMVFGKSE